MEAIVARRKVQDEKDAAHAREKYKEEASIEEAIRQVELRGKIETLKDKCTKLQAELEKRSARIQLSKETFDAEVVEATRVLRLAHESRVADIRNRFSGPESELRKVNQETLDHTPEHDKMTARPITDGQAIEGQNVREQPHGEGMVLTAGHEVQGDAESDLHSPFGSRRKTISDTEYDSPTPVVPVMQSSEIASPFTAQAKKTPSTARAKQPIRPAETGGKLSLPGASIAVKSRELQPLKRNTLKSHAGTKKSPDAAPKNTSNFTSNSDAAENTTQETFLQKCSMIWNEGDKYYEIGCPVPECRQNASKQVGFFKGLAGLKAHIRGQHKDDATSYGLKECTIHTFNDVDCKRLHEGKNPVSRALPAKITAPVLGVATQRSATETDAPGPEVARAFERNVTGTTEASMTPSRKIAPPVNTPTKESTAKDLRDSVAPPKQSPKTPIGGATPAKPRQFDDPSEVVDLLMGSGKKVREGNEGDTPTKRRLAAGVSASLQTRQGASPVAVLESAKGAGRSKEVIATGKIIRSPSDAGTTATPVRSPSRDPRLLNRAKLVQGLSVINEITSPAAKSPMTVPNKATIQARGYSKNTPTGPSQQHLNGNGAYNRNANGLAQQRPNRNATPDRTPTGPPAQRFDAIGTFDRTPGGTSQLRRSGYGEASHEAPTQSSRQAPHNVPRRGGEGRRTRGRGDHYRPSSSSAGTNAEKQSESRRI